MENSILSAQGPLKIHCLRLRRGEDLLLSIQEVCREKHIAAGVVLSAVGCISRGRLRDASGVTVREVNDHCEIVSLNGTVSEKRCHLHIALSKEDLTTIGGHLCPGCVINTTCELVIGALPGVGYDREQDPETGYEELIFTSLTE